MAYIQFTYVAAGRIVKHTITYSERVFRSLSYPARNAHASSCVEPTVVCLAILHFSTEPHKRHDFRKVVTEHNMSILIFSTAFVSYILNSNKNFARYYQKCTEFCM
jgi:hypothetical protein